MVPEPVIANVLATLSVSEGLGVIYPTASTELQINVIGFMGAKRVDLYFNLPLYKKVDNEIVPPFPLARNQVALRLGHGYKWREERGPLAVIGVDTGGGPVKIKGDDGVTVALIQDIDSIVTGGVVVFPMDVKVR